MSRESAPHGEEPKRSNPSRSADYQRYVDDNWGGGLGFVPPFEPGAEIYWAISEGRTKRVKEILKATPDQATIVDDLGEQPIHEAARHDRADIAAMILDLGADIEARDVRGATPLWLAAKSESIETARLLIERGAEIDTADESDYTILRTALVHSTDESRQIAQMLLERGCPVDLESAIFLGDVARVRSLAAESPDLVRRHPRKNDLLGDAISSAESRMDEVIPKAESISVGNYPQDYLLIVELLIELGADPNLRCGVGQLPLNGAIRNTRLSPEFVRLFVKQGAQSDVTDFGGQSPRDVAVMTNNKAALAILDESGE